MTTSWTASRPGRAGIALGAANAHAAVRLEPGNQEPTVAREVSGTLPWGDEIEADLEIARRRSAERSRA